MKKLYIVRHGQSVVNADAQLYFVEGASEHHFGLTPLGQRQARAAGNDLNRRISGPYSVFVSPYLRARETLDGMLLGIDRAPVSISVDARIREQEFSITEDIEEFRKRKAERQAFGKLAYRYKNDENGYDLLARVGQFYEDLRLGWDTGETEDEVLIVAHELVVRCLLILALRLPHEDFETLWVRNCEIYTLWGDDQLYFGELPVDVVT